MEFLAIAYLAYIKENSEFVHQTSPPARNRPFRVRRKYVQGPVIERDVTSGVTFCAILGYLSIAFNGKCRLLCRAVTSWRYRILKYSEYRWKFHLCGGQQWNPRGDRANVGWATRWEARLVVSAYKQRQTTEISQERHEEFSDSWYLRIK